MSELQKTLGVDFWDSSSHESYWCEKKKNLSTKKILVTLFLVDEAS